MLRRRFQGFSTIFSDVCRLPACVHVDMLQVRIFRVSVLDMKAKSFAHAPDCVHMRMRARECGDATCGNDTCLVAHER